MWEGGDKGKEQVGPAPSLSPSRTRPGGVGGEGSRHGQRRHCTGTSAASRSPSPDPLSFQWVFPSMPPSPGVQRWASGRTARRRVAAAGLVVFIDGRRQGAAAPGGQREIRLGPAPPLSSPAALTLAQVRRNLHACNSDPGGARAAAVVHDAVVLDRRSVGRGNGRIRLALASPSVHPRASLLKLVKNEIA